MSTRSEVDGDKTLSRLAGELGAVASAELELRRQLTAAHTEIAAREAELEPLAEELRRTREQRDAAYAELAAMRRTRLWRAGATWWWLRDVVRGARGR